MSNSNGMTIRGGKLVFTESTDLNNEIEHHLQRRFGRGLFVQDTFESPNGEVAIKIGTSYPKDVSDRLERDKVMKYINVGDVYTLHAESAGNEYYHLELPERSDLKVAFQKRRQEIVDRLDYSMARTIFEDVYQLDPVKNQLNSLNQIVRWLGKEGELSVERLNRIQGTGQTEEYLNVLDSFDFVRIEDGMVRPDEKMAAAEIKDIDEYQKVIVGQIIKDAYSTLCDRLDLRMLKHFPKYANSYYYSAIQRQEPNLHLTIEDMQRNLSQEWDDDVDPLILEDKLRKLEQVDVIDWGDDGFVTGNLEIYESISSEAQAASIAD